MTWVLWLFIASLPECDSREFQLRMEGCCGKVIGFEYMGIWSVGVDLRGIWMNPDGSALVTDLPALIDSCYGDAGTPTNS